MININQKNPLFFVNTDYFVKEFCFVLFFSTQATLVYRACTYKQKQTKIVCTIKKNCKNKDKT